MLAVNGLPSPEDFAAGRSSQVGSIVMERPNSWGSGSSQVTEHVAAPISAPGPTPGMPMPLQKITLFRKTVDGDGTTTSSRNVGIGIDCETDAYTGHVVILNVYAGGAANNSGQVFPSDTLLQVNGTSVTGVPTQQVLQMLAGEAGTPVSILVSHNPQTIMSAPKVPTTEKSEAFKVGPTLEEQDAEERRLVREKVRKIFDGVDVLSCIA